MRKMGEWKSREGASPKIGELGGREGQSPIPISPLRYAKLTMRPIITDVSWSVCLPVCLPVCLSCRLYFNLSYTTVSPAKTAEPIDMPFEDVDSGGPNKPCIAWQPRFPREEAILGHVPASCEV